MDLDIHMYNYFESVLLNMSFIFVLFFLYLKYIEGKLTYSKRFITFVAGISMILCMIFSVEIIDGYIIDMRLVPFIIGALYGGRRVGFLLFLALVIFRYWMGGDGFYVTLIHYSFLYSFLWFVTPLFHRANKIKKVYIASIATSADAASLLFTAYMASFQAIVNLPHYLFTVIFLVQIIGVMLFVIFIENAREENLILSEIKRLEKLQIVSEIAASISHEVRNPLTVTKGFLQLLRENEVNQQKKEQYIDYSLTELNRAEEIISDYLTFAKPSLDNIERLEVTKELSYIMNVVKPYALIHNVNVNHVALPDQVYVVGEKQKFHQCFINLMKNGIEAMPGGGNLHIHTQHSHKFVTITIQDTGIGMTKEQLERLGTPYYSTKDKGTGLGTMVVYSIIKAMGGKIKVKSQVNQGTSFTITLPKILNNHYEQPMSTKKLVP